jgi:mRNA interferase MazF
MITSNLGRAGHASRVFVRVSITRETGLLMDSVIMTDNLATVHDEEIDRVLGVLPDLSEVEASLRRTLAL